jgi:hypothetical protein
MQRDIFLCATGTIEIDFGFIGMVAQSKRLVPAPTRGPFFHPGDTGGESRGFELQSGRPSSKREKPAARDDRDKKGKDEATGAALRSVYDNTVNEPVPDQMLDILRKLG